MTFSRVRAPVLPDRLWGRLARLSGASEWPISDERSAAFVDLCEAHGVLALLPDASGRGATIDGLLAARAVVFQKRWLETRVHNERIVRLSHALDGLPFAFIKGADFGMRLYGDGFYRPMTDIDVLVPGRVFAEAGSRLRSAGADPQAPAKAAYGASDHHDRGFLLDGALVELHRGFMQESRYTIDYHALWARTLPSPFHQGARELAAEDALLYQALTLAKDHYLVRWIRYVDFALLLREKPSALSLACDLARAWSACHALFAAAHLMEVFLPGLISSTDLTRVETLVSRRMRGFLASFVLPAEEDLARIPGEQQALSAGRRLWRKTWLLDSWRRRFAFAVSHHQALAQVRPGETG